MAASGRDDLDLDGNWEPLGASAAAAAPAAEQAPVTVRKKRKRKQQAQGADEEGDGVSDFVLPPAFSATPDEPKKKKRRKRKGGAASAGAEVPSGAAGEEELLAWACSRLQAAWAAEAKASSLAPLEQREVDPSTAWFLPCAQDVPLSGLPRGLCGSARASSPALRTLSAIRDGAAPPDPAPRSISVLVLCASAERVFAALGEVREAWPSKPFALAAHGGGRKRDQVTRQAKALGRGVAVAVATPGRVLRLLEEGHVELGGLEVVVLDLTIDRKLRDLLALPETRRDLFGLIQKHLMPLFGKGGRPRLALCRGGTAPKGPKAA